MLQLINQPFDGQLGNILIDKLSKINTKLLLLYQLLRKIVAFLD